MNYFLALSLDREGYKSLALFKGSYAQICEFTTKLNSSEDIREQNKEKITNFINGHQNYIKTIETSSNRRFNGRIINFRITCDNLPPYQEIRVLYKKDLIVFEQILKSEIFIKNLNRFDFKKSKENTNYKRIFHEFLSKKIHFEYNSKVYNREFKKWLKHLKKGDNYYEVVRTTLKHYEGLIEKGVDLPSLTKVYSVYLKNQKESLQTIKKQLNSETIIISDNYREPDFPPNSEDLSWYNRVMKSDIEETIEKKVKIKTKNKQIDGQISLFE